ncbi:MAG: hypothetical protein ACJA1R_003087, partial [Flavobacteriales bacterium]
MAGSRNEAIWRFGDLSIWRACLRLGVILLVAAGSGLVACGEQPGGERVELAAAADAEVHVASSILGGTERKSDGATTIQLAEAYAKLEGTTDFGARVFVNGGEVAVDEHGKFEAWERFSAAESTLTIRALAVGGAQTIVSAQVTGTDDKCFEQVAVHVPRLLHVGDIFAPQCHGVLGDDEFLIALGAETNHALSVTNGLLFDEGSAGEWIAVGVGTSEFACSLPNGASDTVNVRVLPGLPHSVAATVSGNSAVVATAGDSVLVECVSTDVAGYATESTSTAEIFVSPTHSANAIQGRELRFARAGQYTVYCFVPGIAEVDATFAACGCTNPLVADSAGDECSPDCQPACGVNERCAFERDSSEVPSSVCVPDSLVRPGVGVSYPCSGCVFPDMMTLQLDTLGDPAGRSMRDDGESDLPSGLLP